VVAPFFLDENFPHFFTLLDRSSDEPIPTRDECPFPFVVVFLTARCVRRLLVVLDPPFPTNRLRQFQNGLNRFLAYKGTVAANGTFVLKMQSNPRHSYTVHPFPKKNVALSPGPKMALSVCLVVFLKERFFVSDALFP